MVEETLERGVSKPSSLITIYLIGVALALTILGLVMLYSAGVTAPSWPGRLADQADHVGVPFAFCRSVCRFHEFGLVEEKDMVDFRPLHAWSRY